LTGVATRHRCVFSLSFAHEAGLFISTDAPSKPFCLAAERQPSAAAGNRSAA
jgi:hypothetical protein